MRKTILILLAALLSVCLFSCDSKSFEITSLQTQPFVTLDGSMGIAVYAAIKAEEGSTFRMVLHDPSGDLTWELDADQVTVQERQWHGSSDMVMPFGTELPRGEWTVDYVSESGSRESRSFTVEYDDQTVLPTSL